MTQTQTKPRDSWARFGWLVPGAWLVFLYYTVVAVLESDNQALAKVLGIGCIAVFVAVYLVGFQRYMLTPTPTPPTATWRWGFLIALWALTALLSLVIGPLALNLAAYTVAFSAFLFSSRVGAVLGLGTLAVVALVAWQWDPFLWYILAVTTGVFGFGWVMAFLIRVGEREERIRQDLAVVSERERVARDVHDGLGHTLTVVALKAELAERVMDSDPDRARSELIDLRGLIRDALDEVRLTVGALRTHGLAEQVEGLRMTLTGAGVDVVVTGEGSVDDPDLERALGWVLREAVTNVMRHSQAGVCRIEFGDRSVAVIDDGMGMGDAEHGHGLQGMAERVAAVGAVLHVGDAAPRGTRVGVTW